MPDPAIEHLVDDVKAGNVPVVDAVAAFKETKSGYKTTEFWAAGAGLLAINLNGVVMSLPDKWQLVGTSVIIGLYALSRGLAKIGIPAAGVAAD